MKKRMFSILILLASVSAFANADTDVINNVGSGMSSAAGVGGLALIYATAWAPVVAFAALAAIIIGFYFNKFEQKDRGLWKTVDGGNTWSTNTDNLPVIGVSGIVIHPTNNQIMYLATGDGDGADTYSIGI